MNWERFHLYIDKDIRKIFAYRIERGRSAANTSLLYQKNRFRSKQTIVMQIKIDELNPIEKRWIIIIIIIINGLKKSGHEIGQWTFCKRYWNTVEHWAASGIIFESQQVKQISLCSCFVQTEKTEETTEKRLKRISWNQVGKFIHCTQIYLTFVVFFANLIRI